MSLPTFYYSTDPSAPTLSGTAGDLVAVLDACLVNGYGSKVAAGWTKAFAATHGSVYAQGGGNGFGVSVDDNASGAGGAQEALARGYEAPSAVGAGSGPFPTVAQLSTGIVIRKSAAASATTRQWIVVADDRSFYVFVQTGDSAGVYLAFGFGDFYSLLTGDGYRTIICGRATANSSTLTVDNLDLLQGGGTNSAAMTGHYFARAYTGTGGAVEFAKRGDGNVLNSSVTAGMKGAMPYPNPTDGGLYLARVYITDPSTAPAGSIRGFMRGLWQWAHSVASVVDGDTFTGAPGGALAGRSFQIIRASGNGGVYAVETTNWDTSS